MAAATPAQTHTCERRLPICARYARTMPTMRVISTPSRSAMTSALMSAADTRLSFVAPLGAPKPYLGEPNKFRPQESRIQKATIPSSQAEEEYLQAVYTLQDE